MLTAKDARDITNKALENPLTEYELLIESRAKEGFPNAWVDRFIPDDKTKLLEERGFQVTKCGKVTEIAW